MVNNNLAVLFSPNIWHVPAAVTTVSIQKSVQTCAVMPFFNEKCSSERVAKNLKILVERFFTVQGKRTEFIYNGFGRKGKLEHGKN